MVSSTTEVPEDEMDSQKNVAMSIPVITWGKKLKSK